MTGDDDYGPGGERMDEEAVNVNLFEAVCVDTSTVIDVPPDVARRLLHPQTDSSMPLVAVIYRGKVPLQRRREEHCFIGAAPHLGYLAGYIRAAVDRLDARAQAMFTSAYDQGYAEERHRTDPDRRDP